MSTRIKRKHRRVHHISLHDDEGEATIQYFSPSDVTDGGKSPEIDDHSSSDSSDLEDIFVGIRKVPTYGELSKRSTPNVTKVTKCTNKATPSKGPLAVSVKTTHTKPNVVKQNEVSGTAQNEVHRLRQDAAGPSKSSPITNPVSKDISTKATSSWSSKETTSQKTTPHSSKEMPSKASTSVSAQEVIDISSDSSDSDAIPLTQKPKPKLIQTKLFSSKLSLSRPPQSTNRNKRAILKSSESDTDDDFVVETNISSQGKRRIPIRKTPTKSTVKRNTPVRQVDRAGREAGDSSTTDQEQPDGRWRFMKSSSAGETRVAHFGANCTDTDESDSVLQPNQGNKIHESSDTDDWEPLTQITSKDYNKVISETDDDETQDPNADLNDEDNDDTLVNSPDPQTDALDQLHRKTERRKSEENLPDLEENTRHSTVSPDGSSSDSDCIIKPSQMPSTRRRVNYTKRRPSDSFSHQGKTSKNVGIGKNDPSAPLENTPKRSTPSPVNLPGNADPYGTERQGIFSYIKKLHASSPKKPMATVTRQESTETTSDEEPHQKSILDIIPKESQRNDPLLSLGNLEKKGRSTPTPPPRLAIRTNPYHFTSDEDSDGEIIPKCSKKIDPSRSLESLKKKGRSTPTPPPRLPMRTNPYSFTSDEESDGAVPPTRIGQNLGSARKRQCHSPVFDTNKKRKTSDLAVDEGNVANNENKGDLGLAQDNKPALNNAVSDKKENIEPAPGERPKDNVSDSETQEYVLPFTEKYNTKKRRLSLDTPDSEDDDKTQDFLVPFAVKPNKPKNQPKKDPNNFSFSQQTEVYVIDDGEEDEDDAFVALSQSFVNIPDKEEGSEEDEAELSDVILVDPWDPDFFNNSTLVFGEGDGEGPAPVVIKKEKEEDISESLYQTQKAIQEALNWSDDDAYLLDVPESPPGAKDGDKWSEDDDDDLFLSIDMGAGKDITTGKEDPVVKTVDGKQDVVTKSDTGNQVVMKQSVVQNQEVGKESLTGNNKEKLGEGSCQKENITKGVQDVILKNGIAEKAAKLLPDRYKSSEQPEKSRKLVQYENLNLSDAEDKEVASITSANRPEVTIEKGEGGATDPPKDGQLSPDTCLYLTQVLDEPMELDSQIVISDEEYGYDLEPIHIDVVDNTAAAAAAAAGKTCVANSGISESETMKKQTNQSGSTTKVLPTTSETIVNRKEDQPVKEVSKQKDKIVEGYTKVEFNENLTDEQLQEYLSAKFCDASPERPPISPKDKDIVVIDVDIPPVLEPKTKKVAEVSSHSGVSQTKHSSAKESKSDKIKDISKTRETASKVDKDNKTERGRSRSPAPKAKSGTSEGNVKDKPKDRHSSSKDRSHDDKHKLKEVPKPSSSSSSRSRSSKTKSSEDRSKDKDGHTKERSESSSRSDHKRPSSRDSHSSSKDAKTTSHSKDSKTSSSSKDTKTSSSLKDTKTSSSSKDTKTSSTSARSSSSKPKDRTNHEESSKSKTSKKEEPSKKSESKSNKSESKTTAKEKENKVFTDSSDSDLEVAGAWLSVSPLKPKAIQVTKPTKPNVPSAVAKFQDRISGRRPAASTSKTTKKRSRRKEPEDDNLISMTQSIGNAREQMIERHRKAKEERRLAAEAKAKEESKAQDTKSSKPDSKAGQTQKTTKPPSRRSSADQDKARRPSSSSRPSTPQPSSKGDPAVQNAVDDITESLRNLSQSQSSSSNIEPARSSSSKTKSTSGSRSSNHKTSTSTTTPAVATTSTESTPAAGASASAATASTSAATASTSVASASTSAAEPVAKKRRINLPVAKPCSSTVPGCYQPVQQDPYELLKAMPALTIGDSGRPLTGHDFLGVALQWIPKWLQEMDEQEGGAGPKTLPPIVAPAVQDGLLPGDTLWPVPDTFETPKEYMEIMLGHILHETWAAVFSDWRRNKNRPFMSSLIPASLEQKGRFDSILYQGLTYRNQKQSLSEGELVVIHMKVRHAAIQPVFGYVEKSMKMEPRNAQQIHPKLGDFQTVRRNKQMVMNVTIRIFHRDRFFPDIDFMNIESITSLITTIRQIDALIAFPRNPLAKHLLELDRLKTFMPTDHQIDKNIEKLYNPSQTRVINAVVTSLLQPFVIPRVSLVQGPPGTGKSHTILAIIRNTIFRKTADGRTPCLMLCAPSNAAVDELVRRVTVENDIRKKQGEELVRVVRMGSAFSMSPGSLRYSLDTHVTEAWSKRKLLEKLQKMPMSIRKEMLQVHEQLPRLKEQLEAARNAKQENQVRELEQDIALLEKKQSKFDQTDKRNEPNGREQAQLRYEVLAHAHVVCCTLNTAGSRLLTDAVQFGQAQAMNPNYKGPRLQFTGVLIDEACQCVEVEALIPLQYCSTKLVLIGDPQQLPPTVISQDAETMKFSQSLFERLYNYFRLKGHNIVHLLDTQYRMHPEIVVFPSKHVYNDRLKTHPGLAKKRSLFPYRHYIVFDLAYSQEESDRRSLSVGNPSEVQFVVSLVKHLTIGSKVKPQVIGIITPYKQQRYLLQDQLRNCNLDQVDVGTVDGFQGQEKDVIIVSCVRARSGNNKIGFVADKRRMNVALTRAKYGCYVVGHLESLKVDSDWAALIDDGLKRKVVVRVKNASVREDVIRKVCKK